MSEACCLGHAQSFPARKLPCPHNGQVGRPVQRITLGALLNPEARRRIDPNAHYWFCSAPDCETVYYSEQATFSQAEVAVPVWQKRLTPDTPVCYCFGWTPARLKAEPDQQAVVRQITAQVRASNCYCEVTNPQGACCLGNVSEVVRNTRAHRGGESDA